MAVTNNNKRLLSNNPSIITLMLILVDTYGYEVLEWDLETIQKEVHDDFGVELTNSSLNKIAAAISLLTTNEFYTSLPSFIEICNAIASGYGTNVFDPATLEEVAWTVFVNTVMWPEEEAQFSAEIVEYVKVLLNTRGMYKIPTTLQTIVGSDYIQPIESLTEDPIMFTSVHDVQNTYANDIDKVVKDKISKTLTEMTTADLNSVQAIQREEDALKHLKAVLKV